MGFANVRTYIGIIFVFSLLVFGLVSIGNSTKEEPRLWDNLDQEDKQYINNFTLFYKQTSFTEITDNADKIKEKDPFNPELKEENGSLSIPVVSDVLAVLGWSQKQIGRVKGTLLTVYYIPSFFIRGFGIPLEATKGYISVLQNFIFLGLILVAIAILTGNRV